MHFFFFSDDDGLEKHVGPSSIIFDIPHCIKSVQIRRFFWFVFFCIRIEYRLNMYSVRIREKTDQKKLRIWTLFTQCQFQVELHFHTLPSFKNIYFKQLSMLRFLSRCHWMVGKASSYVAKQNSEAATERYFLE